MKTFFILVFTYIVGESPCILSNYSPKELYKEVFENPEQASFFMYEKNRSKMCGSFEGKLYELNFTSNSASIKEIDLPQIQVLRSK